MQLLTRNSALTEFLRSQGISAQRIRDRHLARTAAAERRRERGEGDEHNEDRAELEQELEELGADGSDVEEIIAASRQKRRRADNDDDDDTLRLGDEGAAACANCGCRFTVTVYTVEAENGGFLCRACGRKKTSELRGKKQALASARKKRKALAKALLERSEIKVPTLQSICLSTVVKYIDDVEVLGDVGVENSLMLSRILSRSRKLNPSTMKLFLDPQLKKLEFWDCSELTPDALSLIPAYCPNLGTLVLGMCGQMSNENLMYFATNLPNLRSIYLDGPFLINKSTWMEFLETAGPRLQELTIRSTHRVDAEIIAHLVENCANLTLLTLSRLSDLKDPAAIYLLTELTKLEHLEISFPDQELAASLVTDEGIIGILNQVGSQLHTLNLDGCVGLSDQVLKSAVGPCCGALSTLSLQGTNLTNEGIAEFFENFIINSGLLRLNLERCTNVGDEALKAIVDHSGTTLVELNINSAKNVTRDSLDYMVDRMRNLTTVDLGFVRSVDDELINNMSDSMAHLKSISVYGDARVTQACRPRAGLLLFGRQSDSI